MSKALVLDLHELTMAQAYFKSKRNVHAAFDLSVSFLSHPSYAALLFRENVKLSSEKLIFPSGKQVFRMFDSGGIAKSDVVGFSVEKIKGKKMLRKSTDSGERISKEKDVARKNDIFVKELKNTPVCFLRAEVKFRHPVKISKAQLKFTKRPGKQIKNRAQ